MVVVAAQAEVGAGNWRAVISGEVMNQASGLGAGGVSRWLGFNALT